MSGLEGNKQRGKGGKRGRNGRPGVKGRPGAARGRRPGGPERAEKGTGGKLVSVQFSRGKTELTPIPSPAHAPSGAIGADPRGVVRVARGGARASAAQEPDG